MTQLLSKSITDVYCSNNIISKIWRTLDFIIFNVFIKHRNPLTPITIDDLTTKEEQEMIKERLDVLL